MVFENDFINKTAELQMLTQEVRQDAINFLNEKLGYVRKIDLTDNNVIITYNGDETYVYEVYLSPDHTLIIDTERFGSILLENLRLTDDIINIALEVHEITII